MSVLLFAVCPFLCLPRLQGGLAYEVGGSQGGKSHFLRGKSGKKKVQTSCNWSQPFLGDQIDGRISDDGEPWPICFTVQEKVLSWCIPLMGFFCYWWWQSWKLHLQTAAFRSWVLVPGRCGLRKCLECGSQDLGTAGKCCWFCFRLLQVFVDLFFGLFLACGLICPQLKLTEEVCSFKNGQLEL